MSLRCHTVVLAAWGCRHSMKGDVMSNRVASHALNSDLEDHTPGGSSAPSGNSTPLSDYSPHSQPFAERPESRTTAGMAARQTGSTLPSPPPFTPHLSNVSTAQRSAAGSNKWRSAGAGADTPGVTSAWQQATASPESSSATFAFTTAGEANSPDAQPFRHPEQQVRAGWQCIWLDLTATLVANICIIQASSITNAAQSNRFAAPAATARHPAAAACWCWQGPTYTHACMSRLECTQAPTAGAPASTMLCCCTGLSLAAGTTCCCRRSAQGR